MPILKKVICIVFTMLTTLFFVIALESWHDYQRSFNGPFFSTKHISDAGDRVKTANKSIKDALILGSDFSEIANYFTKMNFICNIYKIGNSKKLYFEYICSYDYSRNPFFFREKLLYRMKFGTNYELTSYWTEILVN